MNCSHHAEFEAVGVCISCGKPLCLECKVILWHKIFCNTCANLAFTGEISVTGKPLKWFERHLNWTTILTWVALYPLNFVVGFLLGLVMHTASSTQSTKGSDDLAFVIIGLLVSAVWLIPTDGWVLKKKGRSLWNLLLLIVPFGIFIFLGLSNENGEGLS